MLLKIHHIRNATLVIETDSTAILVDPMLSDKGTMPSFTEKRFTPQKNPTVELPDNSGEILKKVTHCLITHLHSDHLDKAGEEFLIEHNIPVLCSINDKEELQSKGLTVMQAVSYWKKTPFVKGHLEGIPAVHGYGEVAQQMGNVMGYYIKLPDYPSIYLSSDTIFTKDVKHVLNSYKPDICVVAAGSAQLDEYDPILMTLDDITAFIEESPQHVIANHMEAVNHCTTTRQMLKNRLSMKGLNQSTWVPLDGESRDYQSDSR